MGRPAEGLGEQAEVPNAVTGVRGHCNVLWATGSCREVEGKGMTIRTEGEAEGTNGLVRP